ncbi:MAG: hypothetical protein GTO63_24805 [Anaerolineae bacterium]|nr:hypothetical protein [Anaerolineae bacterium]NIN97947.1 hypothetical protein [Anaerolineae bacterium]NIQ80914.1 hypothetical protein [Anaerolineae bacterium]
MRATARLRFLTRHVLAYWGSLPAFACIWLCTYDYHGIWNLWEPPANLCYCGEIHLRLALVIIPVSVLGEFMLVRWLGWRWWAHIPIMAGMFVVASAAATEVILLALFGERLGVRYDLTVAFLQDAIWGIVYWCLLRLCDRLPPRIRPEDARAPWDFG